jgi:hypothetical protein
MVRCTALWSLQRETIDPVRIRKRRTSADAPEISMQRCKWRFILEDCHWYKANWGENKYRFCDSPRYII